MKILILEDNAERIFQFKKRLISIDVTFTDKPKEAIDLLKNNKYEYLMLDHDMGNIFESPGEGTGYEVAMWIANNPEHAPDKIFLHTSNNIGAAAMLNVLGNVGIRATYIPFLWEKIKIE
jgi:CheY-like chemotaxis protein